MSSSSSSPTPSESPPPSSNSSNTSSNLYLVTFLATLFLLLFVSCAIVLRSFILRRRYQRRLEEALAAGIILTPRSPGSKRKRFGAKPKLFEAYLSDGGEKWEDIIPLAAQPVTSKRRYKDKNNGSNQLPTSPPPSAPSSSHHHITLPSPTSPAHQPASGRHTHRPPLWKAFLPRRARPLDDDDDDTPVDEILPTNDPVKPTHIRIELLQVSVLVAMPSPTRSNRRKLASGPVSSLNGKERALDEDIYEEEDSVIPEIAIGVTRCTGWKHQQHPQSQQPKTEQDDAHQTLREYARV